jgi:ABC-type transport system involved in cytochrome bd biosynthesis fused ATPase/permease subunit
MKNIFKKCDMSSIILTTIYKISIYACWYLFAFMFLNFIRDGITDTKLIMLVISIIVIYAVRNVLKTLYKSTAPSSYHNIKHNIEMYYFSKFESLDYKAIENMELNTIADKILLVSYNITKIISDIGEYIIPCILGLIILFVKLLDINFILGIVILALLIFTVVTSYNNSAPVNNINNYNDLLKDFINKMLTIKKLNVFNYCYRLLDSYTESDICFLHNSENNDIKFSNKILVILMIMLLSTFIFIHETTSRLGIILFMLIIIVKLFDLLCSINPFIKNIRESIKNVDELNNEFISNREVEYIDNFKNVSVRDAIITYGSDKFSLNIPEFDLENKDHIDIMGKSGQGKSTILNILSGLFVLDSGTITIDGKCSKKYLNAYYSTPNTNLFNISLRDNLLLGSSSSDDYIIDLIREINLIDWFNSLSDGLDTIMNDDIDNTTRQKLNLIRGILLDRKVFFLDNPTYELDLESEKKVSSMIKKYLKDKTYIIVSNRPVITTICKKHYFIKDHTLKSKEPLL